MVVLLLMQAVATMAIIPQVCSNDCVVRAYVSIHNCKQQLPRHCEQSRSKNVGFVCRPSVEKSVHVRANLPTYARADVRTGGRTYVVCVMRTDCTELPQPDKRRVFSHHGFPRNSWESAARGHHAGHHERHAAAVGLCGRHSGERSELSVSRSRVGAVPGGLAFARWSSLLHRCCWCGVFVVDGCVGTPRTNILVSQAARQQRLVVVMARWVSALLAGRHVRCRSLSLSSSLWRTTSYLHHFQLHVVSDHHHVLRPSHIHGTAHTSNK